MKKLLQQGLLSALVISITACGGGSSHSTPVATATSSSAISTASSAASSSVASVATTTYNVSVDVPTSFATQAAIPTLQQKVGQFFIASAYADGVSTLTAANFAVVIVDLSGKVLERVALADSDISKNSDGSWALTVPGKPRLDCIIVADVTKPIELPVAANINQGGFVFAPTTAETVAIDVGSTAAFQNFIQELGGTGSFQNASIDPTDTKQIKAVENLVNNVRTVVANQSLTGYSNVADALLAIKSTVNDTVKQEVVNVKSPASGTAVTLIRDEGGLFYFEGKDFDEIGYGGIVGTEPELKYVYDGEKFVVDTEESDGQLVLSSNGWVATADKSKVINFNDVDGTVTLQDALADGSKEVGEVTQVFDLAGRNISQYFAANYKTALLGKMANPESTFTEGAKGYRIKITNPADVYYIYSQPGNEDGFCPWNSSLTASTYNDNCNVVMTAHASVQSGVTAASTLSDVFSADVQPSAEGFVAVNLPNNTTSGMILVQLLDNPAKTERFYLQSWASGSISLIGTGTWTELMLSGLTENSRVIHVQIPKEVIAAANNSGSTNTTNTTNTSAKSSSSDSKSANNGNGDSKSASSEGTKTTTSESARSASSATVKTGNDEGDKSGGGDSKNNSLDFYMVRQAGFVRQLFIEPAGVHSEDVAAVFNGQARTNILAALDYTRPSTLLPTATIDIDGNATDWADVTPAIVDPAGDQKGTTSTDLTQVSIARSGDKVALLMKVAGNFAFPYAPERDYSNYEVALHFFSNGNCLGQDNGFLIANNFTSAAGENTHRLDYYFSDSTSATGPTTTVASTGSVLETSFYFDQLPSDKGDYVTLTAAIHAFVGSQPFNYDLNDTQATCYKIR